MAPFFRFVYTIKAIILTDLYLTKQRASYMQFKGAVSAIPSIRYGRNDINLAPYQILVRINECRWILAMQCNPALDDIARCKRRNRKDFLVDPDV